MRLEHDGTGIWLVSRDDAVLYIIYGAEFKTEILPKRSLEHKKWSVTL